jgi:hypothetical protein
MASITFLPGSVPIETLNGSPGEQGAPGAPVTNANQAQNAPAPADTVVLTGRIAETQLNGYNANGAQTDQAAIYAPPVGVFGRQGSGTAIPQAQPALPTPTGAPQTPQPIAQAAAAASPTTGTANSADPAIAAAVAANSQPNANGGDAAAPAGGNGNTPQQQLAHLDQTLQQLGIDPQSISLFNRMGMLLYANDPAALRVMVQEIQNGAQGAQSTPANPTAGQTAQTAPSSANQAVPEAQAQAVAQVVAIAPAAPANSGQVPPANRAQTQPQPPAPAPAQIQDQNSTSAGGAQSQQVLTQFAANGAQEAAQNNNGAGPANHPAHPEAGNQAANAQNSIPPPNANSGTPDAHAASGNPQTINAAAQFESLQFTFSEFGSQNSQSGDQNSGFGANGQGQTLNITV